MIKTSHLQHEVSLGGESLALLKDVNLTIDAKDTVAIVGASGSGKTTLLGMLAGLDVPSSGHVFIDDVEITALSESERATIRANNLSFVFQNFQLLGSLTAIENVALVLEVHNKPNAKQVAREFLARVGLENRLNHYPKQLSGGEQQRVALARAFASQAPILFADEPTGNLDSHTGHAIEALLFELNKEFDTTLVLVTHDEKLAENCAKKFVMEAGVLSAPYKTTIEDTL